MTFKFLSHLNRHIQGVHQEGLTSMFKCAVCLKEFKQKSHLKTHLKNVHHQDMDPNIVSDLPTQVPVHNLLFKENPPTTSQTFSVFSNWTVIIKNFITCTSISRFIRLS